VIDELRYQKKDLVKFPPIFVREILNNSKTKLGRHV